MDDMLILTLFLVFCTIGLVGYLIVPGVYGKVAVFSENRQRKFSSHMETLMPRQQAMKISRLFVFAPIVFAIVLYILFPIEFRFLGIVMGLVGGLLFPGMYIRGLTQKTREKFGNQLIDALMIMSSSFRGGFSLVQALEAVVEEMPDPINKEIRTVLGENKMGVSLDEALNHLYKRMPSVALQQMNTAILLARETGGNLPVIFNRIVNNIRESKKIQQNLDTLTVQGKIQGVVMSLLPLGFASIVYSTNRQIFDHMLHSTVGKNLLIYAAVSEIIGVFFIWKISTFKDF